MREPEIALIGNPNSGKSSLFNRLTGANQHIGNWPGVTVERISGHCVVANQTVNVVDLPGTYALSDIDSEASIDERIAQSAVVDGGSDLYLNIVDATNLERHLFLTSQLCERGLNMVLVVNMVDLATNQHTVIDTDALAASVGCPVVAVSANTGEGMAALKAAIATALSSPVAAAANTANMSVGAHYERVENWANAAVSSTRLVPPMTERLDRIVLNRFLGIPIFLAVIYIMFLFSVNVGGAFIDVFDGLGALFFVDTPHLIMAKLGVPQWLAVFIADGIGGGLQLVATFIPVIGAMFLILAWLEDSGYMARAAFVMDRVMRQVGLPGKAFVPLIVGFGCNVPAVMAARTLEHERDRITAILMAPFMSCGARLTVYALFAAAFFPTGGHNIVFALYLIGILVAVLSAFAMKKTLLKGESGHFVMELPNYHLPLLRNIITRTWHRLSGFVSRAGKAIVVVVVILNVVNSVGTDGSYGNQNTEKSALSAIGKTITPIFAPMGLSEDNWPATVGIFTGMFAKEVVVGTLDSLYSQAPADDSPYDFTASLVAALKTVPDNLLGLADQVLDPLGLAVLAASDIESAAGEQDVSTSTFGAMQSAFDGKAGAFAYLLFVLLYVPCVATIGAIYKELTAGWSVFITAWSLASGYGIAVLFYQAATFTRNPIASTSWIAGIIAFMALVMLALRRKAALNERRVAASIIARSR